MLRVFTDNRELRHRAQAKSQRNSAAELWAIILSGLTALNWFGFSLFMMSSSAQPTKSVNSQSYSNGNTAPCLRACVRASPAPSHRFRARVPGRRCVRIPSPCSQERRVRAERGARGGGAHLRIERGACTPRRPRR
jgi:hypothetical protein